MSNPEPPGRRSLLDRLAPLAAGAIELEMELGAAELERFGRYLDLVVEWEERAGLTSLRDPGAIQRRHFLESIALLRALRDAELIAAPRTRVVDVGPGGGFPGLPMRIMEPAIDLTMIESHGRRASFLRHAARAMELDRVEVLEARVEDAAHDPALRGAFDLAVVRAVAPLAVLVEYALPLLRVGGVLAAPKGSNAERELAEAAVAIETLGGTALPPLSLPLPPAVPPQRALLVRRTGPIADRYPRRPGIPAKRPLR